MSTTNFPKCRTCRHFHPWESNSIYGHCVRLEKHTGSDEFSILFNSREEMEVEVNADKFGCLLHSELETDQQKGEG